MRVGIVGVGAMGGTHAAAWAQTDVDLVGFVATSTLNAYPLAQRYSAHSFPDLAAMLPNIDVVDICTPTHLHHAMVCQAAAAGVDIICEKPIARTMVEAQEIVQICASSGVRLLVAHVVRFFPEYRIAHEAVTSGEIGDVAVVRLKRNVFRPRKARDNWFLEFEKSGGMILDLMIHDFDYARWIAGEVKTVFCKHIGDPKHSPGDHGLAILSHENGAISHIEGSWAYPPPTFRTQFEIAGSEGLLIHDSVATAPLSLHWHQGVGDVGGDVPVPASPLLEDPYFTEINTFYQHLTRGTPIPVTAADGVAALQIALAAISSAARGEPVHLQKLTEVQG